MNKKLLMIMSIATVSAVLHGMELKLNTLKRTKTVEQGSESRRPEGTDNTEGFRLNMENIPEPVFADLHGKPSIKSLKQVSNLKSQQNTYRASTARGANDTQSATSRVRRSNNNNLIVQNDDNQKDDILGINNSSDVGKCNNVEVNTVRSRVEDLLQDERFSEKEVWDFIEALRPEVYGYMQEHDMDIGEYKKALDAFDTIDPHVQNLLKELKKKRQLSPDQMMEYAYLLNGNSIEPEVLAELLQQQHSLGEDDTKLLVQKLGSMQKNNKEQYLGLALDFLTRTLDEGGVKKPSPIHAAHVAIQNDAIAEEKKYKWISVVGNVIFVLASAGMTIWGAYGQITKPTTQAPTNAPTYAPTMFPTGAPT